MPKNQYNQTSKQINLLYRTIKDSCSKLMPHNRRAINPEPEFMQTHSNIFKNTQSIGRIYSKKQLALMRDSSDSINFDKNHNSRKAFKEQILLGAQSPLVRVNRLQVQLSGKFGHSEQINGINDNNSSILEINPVTNKSFRISRLYSSDMNNFSHRKKTPQLIGKLSTSKLNQEIYSKESRINAIENHKNRSPGHLTQRKPYKRSHKQHINPITSPQISRFMQFMDKNLITSQQLSQTQLNPQNKLLLQQVKHKQEYLKQIIEKRKKASSQQPIPPKNIQEFKYNYPVTKNSQLQKNNHKNKTSPYLQKIEQNSRLFEGSLMSPRFLNKVKEVTASRITNDIRKGSRFNNDRQEVLEKSRDKQMKISPEVNVSFTIKSPKRKQEADNKLSMAQQQAINDVQEWRENLSRVSLYSPEKNFNFNNRKPKFVSMLIDPSQEELQNNPQIKNIKILDLKFLAQHFSRSRNYSSLTQQQPHYINLKTTLSTIKQLLIESGPILSFQMHLPSCLFTTPINPSIEIKDIHLFIEKVYNQMRIRPEIITIKRYKNAIFTGVLQSKTKEWNFFNAIVYHFSGRVYVGGWKQSTSPFDMHKDKVDGEKHGMGLEILYHQKKPKIEEINNVPNNDFEKNQNTIPTSNPIELDIYYGQFKDNKRQGYGIRFRAKSFESELTQQLTEIGCWSQGQKNGWVKIYHNNQLQSNAEYQNGKKVKQLALRDQKEPIKPTGQNA